MIMTSKQNIKKFLVESGLDQVLEAGAQRLVRNLIETVTKEEEAVIVEAKTYNPYSVLGLEPNAEQEVVEVAYRALAKKYHPDIVGGDGDEFKRIKAAYDQIKQEVTSKDA